MADASDPWIAWEERIDSFAVDPEATAAAEVAEAEASADEKATPDDEPEPEAKADEARLERGTQQTRPSGAGHHVVLDAAHVVDLVEPVDRLEVELLVLL